MKKIICLIVCLTYMLAGCGQNTVKKADNVSGPIEGRVVSISDDEIQIETMGMRTNGKGRQGGFSGSRPNRQGQETPEDGQPANSNLPAKRERPTAETKTFKMDQNVTVSERDTGNALHLSDVKEGSFVELTFAESDAELVVSIVTGGGRNFGQHNTDAGNKQDLRNGN